MKVEHNNRFPREEQIPYHRAERWSEAADMGQAEEIRQYSIKKFYKVFNDQGEYLMAHIDSNIFYYCPGTREFLGMHTPACHCTPCDQLVKPTKTQPLQYAPLVQQTSHTLKLPEDSKETNWEHLSSTCEWEENPFPAEWSASNYEPQSPRYSPQPTAPAMDETRPLEPEVRTPRKTRMQNIEADHQVITARLAKLDPIHLRICPDIPTYSKK
jgi:hypothetical protein